MNAYLVKVIPSLYRLNISASFRQDFGDSPSNVIEGVDDSSANIRDGFQAQQSSYLTWQEGELAGASYQRIDLSQPQNMVQVLGPGRRASLWSFGHSVLNRSVGFSVDEPYGTFDNGQFSYLRAQRSLAQKGLVGPLIVGYISNPPISRANLIISRFIKILINKFSTSKQYVKGRVGPGISLINLPI